VSIGEGPALEFDRMAWFTKSRSQKRRGVLTLEWVLLVTVIIIGIIGGLGAVRNATNGELLDLAEAIESLNVKTAAELAAEGP
jgi:Flp pilus assembly pilin Flp